MRLVFRAKDVEGRRCQYIRKILVDMVRAVVLASCGDQDVPAADQVEINSALRMKSNCSVHTHPSVARYVLASEQAVGSVARITNTVSA